VATWTGQLNRFLSPASLSLEHNRQDRLVAGLDAVERDDCVGPEFGGGNRSGIARQNPRAPKPRDVDFERTREPLGNHGRALTDHLDHRFVHQ
jgi:hypothetical protein